MNEKTIPSLSLVYQRFVEQVIGEITEQILLIIILTTNEKRGVVRECVCELFVHSCVVVVKAVPLILLPRPGCDSD